MTSTMQPVGDTCERPPPRRPTWRNPRTGCSARSAPTCARPPVMRPICRWPILSAAFTAACEAGICLSVKQGYVHRRRFRAGVATAAHRGRHPARRRRAGTAGRRPARRSARQHRLRALGSRRDEAIRHVSPALLAGGVDRRSQQRDLLRAQCLEVVGRATPAGFWPAPQCTKRPNTGRRREPDRTRPAPQVGIVPFATATSAVPPTACAMKPGAVLLAFDRRNSRAPLALASPASSAALPPGPAHMSSHTCRVGSLRSVRPPVPARPAGCLRPELPRGLRAQARGSPARHPRGLRQSVPIGPAALRESPARHGRICRGEQPT